VYFIIFTIIAALVLMTLFIGVVTTSMETCKAKQRHEAGTSYMCGQDVFVSMCVDVLRVYVL